MKRLALTFGCLLGATNLVSASEHKADSYLCPTSRSGLKWSGIEAGTWTDEDGIKGVFVNCKYGDLQTDGRSFSFQKQMRCKRGELADERQRLESDGRSTIELWCESPEA